MKPNSGEGGSVFLIMPSLRHRHPDTPAIASPSSATSKGVWGPPLTVPCCCVFVICCLPRRAGQNLLSPSRFCYFSHAQSGPLPITPLVAHPARPRHQLACPPWICPRLTMALRPPWTWIFRCSLICTSRAATFCFSRRGFPGRQARLLARASGS